MGCFVSDHYQQQCNKYLCVICEVLGKGFSINIYCTAIIFKELYLENHNKIEYVKEPCSWGMNIFSGNEFSTSFTITENNYHKVNSYKVSSIKFNF